MQSVIEWLDQDLFVQALFYAVPCGFLLVDRTGQIQTVNHIRTPTFGVPHNKNRAPDITLRTQTKRLVRRMICWVKTARMYDLNSRLFVKRYEDRRVLYHAIHTSEASFATDQDVHRERRRKPMRHKKRLYVSVLIWAAALGILYLTSRHDYLLFHTLAEIFSVAVAVAIFMLVWNVRRSLDNPYLLFVGVAYLFVGCLDMVHTLAYQGMDPFERYETNLQSQLWIASRYVQSLSLLIGSFFLGRRLKLEFVLVGYVAATALLLGSIVYWQVFPACFVEGVGLTPFQTLSVYVTVLILAAAIAMLGKKRDQFDPAGLRFLVVSIVCTILSELCFSVFTDVYGFLYFLGHGLQVVSFYCIYKAIIDLGLSKPFAVLFRNLKQSEDTLRRERDFISAILSTAGALVVILDREGRVVRFNKACERLTGYAFEEAEGRPFWDLCLTPEQAGSVQAAFEQMRLGQFSNEHETYWVAKDGSRRCIMWSNAVLLDSGGAVDYVIGTGIDITARRRAQEALKQAHDELERQVQERTAELVGANQQLAQHIDERRRTEKELRESEQQLRNLSSQLLTAQETERRRIARELHDELGGALAVLKLKTSFIEKNVQPDQTAIREECKQTLWYIDQIIDHVRRFSHDLSPSILEDIGLMPALRSLIDNVVRYYGIKAATTIENVDHLLPRDDQIMLYRIFQEALTNIGKHAQAGKVVVEVRGGDDKISCLIEDDGRGFDVRALSTKTLAEVDTVQLPFLRNGYCGI
jgi:PAS domain S-box-containing protein